MKPFNHPTLALALASAMLLQAGVASGQTAEEEEDLALAYGDKATVSLATGSAQPLRRAPAVATVITAEEIKAMGATDLDEALESVPGLHVARTAGNYFSTYSIRGIVGNPTNPQVLMLQNGIPTNDLYRGDKGEAWGGLPLENVARIEIIRGPGSALYGADAFSGVINIITKTAADTAGTEFGVRGGSFNTQNAWVRHGGKLGPMDVAAYLRVGSTDGFKETITSDAATRLFNLRGGGNPGLAPGPVNTGHDDIDANLDLGYDKWRFRAGYKLRDHVGTGAGVSSALDPVGKEKSERINADVSWTDAQFSKNLELGFTGSYLSLVEQATTFNLFPPDTVFPGGSTFPNGMIGSPGRSQRQIRVSGYASYSGFANHSLRLGLGHEDLNLYDVRTMKNFRLTAGAPTPDLAFNGGSVVDYSASQPHLLPHRRFNNYFYAQDQWDFVRDWTLTAGVRHDQFSDFGATTNPRLALVWDTMLDLTSKLLLGRAFRAPSFAEQYGVNPVANGNPNLKPEGITTLEAAFAWQARKDTRINLSLFRYHMKDTIRAVANPAGTGSTFANTGKLNGRGAELEAEWDASRTLRLTGSYSYQKSIDEASNTDAGYAPRNHVYARADWRFSGNWMLSPQLNWVASTKRAINDTRPEVPAYTSMDLTLRNERDKGPWSFAASIRNLFNAANFDPSLYVASPNAALTPTSAIPNDLPLPGRSLYVEATYKM